MRQIFSFTMALIAAICFLTPVVVSSEEVQDKLDLQLVAHQKTVGTDSKIDYSILYHVQADKQGVDHEWRNEITINVPKNLSVIEKSGANWDEQQRTLTWKLDYLKDGQAGVIDFTLKTDADTPNDTTLTVSATGYLENGFEISTPPVNVVVGSEKHQPFFQGYPDGTFRPDSYITRAEVAAIISRIKNLTNDNQIEEPYKDVPKNHWAYSYINKVTNANYMQGYDSQFHPDKPITRAEMMTLILRLRGIDPIPISASPNTIGHWANEVIGTSRALGFTTDTAENALLPDAFLPRDESARLLNVAFSRGKLTDGETAVIQHFPDVSKDHWAFQWIEEASMVAHETIRSGDLEYIIQYLPDETEEF